MVKKTILENNYASLWYYPKEKIIHHKFHKYIFGDMFREVMTKGADIFIEKGCTKWLSDDRNNWVLKQEDVDWGDVNWGPRVIKAGWKYWAIILPDKVIGKMNMKILIDYYLKKGITIDIFEDVAEALQWLTNQ